MLVRLVAKPCSVLELARRVVCARPRKEALLAAADYVRPLTLSRPRTQRLQASVPRIERLCVRVCSKKGVIQRVTLRSAAGRGTPEHAHVAEHAGQRQLIPCVPQA
eukprot:363567-Chlamydomonas_euryale.AAC.5